MELNIGGDSKEGGGVIDNGGKHQAAPEHGCTVHRYAITVRPVRGVGKGTRGASRDAMVGTGGT